jgi:glycosyltransferase involved in cell wall biosynthesis
MISQKPLISIIVPVYNVEQYLTTCIESILSQTYIHFELFLVNDGSNDSSGHICDDYALKDRRIIVIHQENKGASAARNTSLKATSGMFVTFVDADDWLDPCHLENLINKAVEEDADIVLTSYWINGQKETYYSNCPSSMNGYVIIKESLEMKIHAGVWTKLIKKSIIDNNCITFPKYDYYEDIYFSAVVLLKARKITYCDSSSYHYRMNQNSQTYSVDYKIRLQKYYEMVNNLKDLFTRYDLNKHTELVDALYMTINTNKKRLNILPLKCTWMVHKALKEFPESYRVCKKKRIGDKLIRLSIKYKLFILMKGQYLISKVKSYFTSFTHTYNYG